MNMKLAILEVTKVICHESLWTQKVNARDGSGRPVSPLSVEASRFCLNGAVIKAIESENISEVKDFLRKIMKEKITIKYNSSWPVTLSNFNDLSLHYEVMDLLRIALDKC